jgi:hypothetical protein
MSLISKSARVLADKRLACRSAPRWRSVQRELPSTITIAAPRGKELKLCPEFFGFFSLVLTENPFSSFSAHNYLPLRHFEILERHSRYFQTVSASLVTSEENP